MRTSRVSRDTARVFNRSSASPPRRTTRASLTRFAHTNTASGTGATAPELTDVKVRHGAADIEDAIGRPVKRQRRTSTSVTTTGLSASATKTEVVEDALPSLPPKKAPRARKPARKTTNTVTGEEKISPPSDWEAMYASLKAMRTPGGPAYPSAVDTMGCERLADPDASEKDQRYHTLVALMLSSQTKDTVNAVAMARLKSDMPAAKPGGRKGLCLENMLAVDPKLLNEMIWAVGFHNNKTKYLKQTAEILRDEWNGDIPDTIEGLTSLPGVGPKMGYLCLSAAWDKTEGIGVDVHVHRITNLWGWNKTKNPEETRMALQSWLPRDKWREINSLLVGFGQTVCLPVGRKCGECELGLEGLCKSAERKKIIEGKRVRQETVVKEMDEDGKVLVKQEEVITKEIKTEERVVNGSDRLSPLASRITAKEADEYK